MAGLLTIGSGSARASEPTAAEGSSSDQICVSQEIDHHMQVGVSSLSPVFPIAIPAGVVSIPVASARDAYPGRANATQLSERWELQFIAADGSVVATSSPTGDVPDGEDDQTWSGPLEPVVLPVDAVGIRAQHRPDLPPGPGGMSVTASGISLCWDTPTPLPPTPPTPTIDCGTTPDGAPIPAQDDGTCPPKGPSPCPDDEGNSSEASNEDPNNDGSCASPTTPSTPTTSTPNVDCGTTSSGAPIPAEEDGACPPSIPDQTPPAPAPPEPDPPTLPVTGVGTTLLLSLIGIFVVAAGTSLVLRPRAVFFERE